VQTLAEASGGAVPDFLAPREMRDQLCQDGYALTTIELNVTQGGQAADAVLQAIRREAAALYKTAYLTGGAALTNDLRAVTDRDIVRVNGLSVIAIAAIIALAFSSLTIPVLLVLAIQFAIWVNLAGAAIFGTNLYFITYLVLGAVQMGATVDYAILITSRFKELLHDHDATTAMELAVASGGRSILTSSLTLTCATLAVGLLSNIRMAGQLCATLGVGAAISMLTAIFIVPSLLLVSQPLISRTTRDWPASHAQHQAPAVTSTSASGRE
jgi:predicted RND superfamily exporter protein